MSEWIRHFIGWDTAVVLVFFAAVYCLVVRILKAARRHAAQKDQEAGR